MTPSAPPRSAGELEALEKMLAGAKDMPAISLWQPWASLWCSLAKVHETRHWPTKHRGWLLVHAAQRFEKDFDSDFANILRREFGHSWHTDLPRGAIIGAVDLIDCAPTESVFPVADFDNDDYLCGDFSPGRFAWKSGLFKVFERPIPWRGAQGFFRVPTRALARPEAEER